MKEITFPPKFITKLSIDERLQIAELIKNQDEIGLAWLQKIRKFISFHNRNLKNISFKRFNEESSSHLTWMKDIITQQIFSSKEKLIDVAMLNAALIISDTCQLDFDEKRLLNNILIKHEENLINTSPRLPKNFKNIKMCTWSIDDWRSSNFKKIPITIFCPSPYSLFSITVLKMLLAINIDVKAIVVLKFSFSRIKSEFYRDGSFLFFKRVWRKLILRADENNVKTDLSLKQLKNSIAPEISDIRKLAKKNSIPCLMVNNFHEILDVEKNKAGDLCLFTGGGILSKQVLAYFNQGIINIHMGPLPQYKGMDVVEAPILDGIFNNLALTSHLMEPELDAGPLISQMIFFADEYQSLEELRNEMGAMMPIIAVDSITSILSKQNFLYEQPKLGQQYYFIHQKLRDIISKVMFTRFNLSKSSTLDDREKKLRSFKELISSLNEYA